MRRYAYIAALLGLSALLSWAKKPAPSWVPQVFNGWQITELTVESGSVSDAVDSADAAVLNEYGFTDYATATYTRNGRSMQVKAVRFKDSSGAYGAFTFYAQPQMQKEDIGDRGLSNNERVLFYRGNILVEVHLEQVTAMSASDLRALAEALPRPKGENSVPPNLPGYLPKESLVANTDRYIEGRVALARLGVPIPAELIDFSKGPDVEFAKYAAHDGRANLTMVSYPTPQIAAERLKAWQAASLPGGPFYFRRSGPLLVAVNGNVSEAEAHSLLGAVNYDADVTWNQAARRGRNEDQAGFIVALILLVIIVLVIALIIGLAFGGLRLWAKRLFTKGAVEHPDDIEIIRLNLK